MNDAPLIILGVDGLDWTYVDRHRELVPTLSGWPLLRPLASIFPPDSIPAWTTIFTGSPPGDHGVIESIDYLDKKPTAAADVASEGLPGRTFWDEASRRGGRVCVVNAFLAYPAWDVNGAMVSGPVFVTGDMSITGIEASRARPAPELGGIVSFPTENTIGPFVQETLSSTKDQAAYGLRLFDHVGPDLFFLNILTIDRLQHFTWRFCDASDPTYPGPNPHSQAVAEGYALTDRIAAEYSQRGRVVIMSDHGHGRRCTRMLFVDEVLRRAGLLHAGRRRLSSVAKGVAMEQGKRLALGASYRFNFEERLYRAARRLPNRKALKQSSFSSDASTSLARLSRAFGRNQHSGVELATADPSLRESVKEALKNVRDPLTGGGVFDWIADRSEVVSGSAESRYPEILFKMKDGYGVDFGIYRPLFSPDVNHRRVSGGHKELGVLATSFTPSGDPPRRVEDIYEFVLANLSA